MSSFFRQIVWSGIIPLSDKKQWEKNVALVETLCGLAEEVDWMNQDEGGTYPHMVFGYYIQGVYISFLPHWGYYEVGGIKLPLPKDDQSLQTAIEAVKTLQSLGLRS